MSDWQPIETAPRDGTEVLLVFDGKVTFGAYVEYSTLSGYWWNAESIGPDEGQPTHWMLPPPPPKVTK